MVDPDRELDEQFQRLYRQWNEQHQLELPTAITAVEAAAHAFFDEHIGDADPAAAADRFFNYIGVIWLPLFEARLYDFAEGIWQESLAIAHRWEQSHRPMLLHKGTPFYMWGGTAIVRGNIRKGFLLIHASLAEDKRKHYRQDEDPDSPSRKFVTLDARTNNQFLRDLVQVGTNELEQRLAAYQATSGSTLQFSELQSRYATQHDIREIVFIFTMAVFEAINLRTSFAQVGAGDEFGAQLAANCLFDLCQVVEESIRVKHPLGKTFKPLAEHLALQYGWQLNPNPFVDLNNQQQNNFDATVHHLVSNTALAQGRPPATVLERDVWLTYVVRNSTAHGLASKQVLQKQFDTVYQSILNMLFAVVDKLYP